MKIVLFCSIFITFFCFGMHNQQLLKKCIKKYPEPIHTLDVKNNTILIGSRNNLELFDSSDDLKKKESYSFNFNDPKQTIVDMYMNAEGKIIVGRTLNSHRSLFVIYNSNTKKGYLQEFPPQSNLYHPTCNHCNKSTGTRVCSLFISGKTESDMNIYIAQPQLGIIAVGPEYSRYIYKSKTLKTLDFLYNENNNEKKLHLITVDGSLVDLDICGKKEIKRVTFPECCLTETIQIVNNKNYFIKRCNNSPTIYVLDLKTHCCNSIKGLSSVKILTMNGDSILIAGEKNALKIFDLYNYNSLVADFFIDSMTQKNYLATLIELSHKNYQLWFANKNKLFSIELPENISRYMRQHSGKVTQLTTLWSYLLQQRLHDINIVFS